MSAAHVQRNRLLAALRAVAAVVPSGGAVSEILTDIRLRFTAEGQLQVYGTDTEIEILRSVSVDSGLGLGGPATVYAPARELVAGVGRFTGDVVAMTPMKGKLVMQSNRTEVSVKTRAESTMPDGMAFEPHSTIRVDAIDLKRCIAQSVYACAEDNTRPGLGGVLLERAGDRLRLVATDGHRLGWGECQFAGDLQPMVEHVVPPALLATITRGPDEGDVELAIGPQHMQIRRPGEIITGRLFEGGFPDYRSVIPDYKDARHRVVVDREAFLAALRRQPKGRTTRWEVVAEQGEVTVVTQVLGGEFDLLEVRDVLAADIQGGTLTLGMNGTFPPGLMGALIDDRVELFMSHALAPVFVRGVTDDTSAGILMPMRLL